MTAWLSLLRIQGAPQSIRQRIASAGAVLARGRARLQPSISRALNRWHGLTPRERKQVLLMLAVFVAAVLWLLFTKPALDSLRYWGDEMPRLRSRAAALRDVLADVSTPHRVEPTSTQPVSERVRASLDQGGFAGAYQVRNSGSDLVVAIEQPVACTQLAAWVMSAPATLGLNVKRVTLQRDDGEPAGQTSHITATVTLTGQQQQPRNGT